MALPVIKTPEYSMEVPSTGEEIKYRPFLVGEEKLLLLAMEGESDTEIQNAVMNLTKNKTTLVIAHRLSTIIRADKIILINRGEISDFGTHGELLKSSMIYKNLYSKQLSA